MCPSVPLATDYDKECGALPGLRSRIHQVLVSTARPRSVSYDSSGRRPSSWLCAAQPYWAGRRKAATHKISQLRSSRRARTRRISSRFRHLLSYTGDRPRLTSRTVGKLGFAYLCRCTDLTSRLRWRGDLPPSGRSSRHDAFRVNRSLLSLPLHLPRGGRITQPQSYYSYGSNCTGQYLHYTLGIQLLNAAREALACPGVAY